MNLPKLTIIYAVLLILLGLVGFFGFGRSSVTALIPAFFGLVLLVVGIFALIVKIPPSRHAHRIGDKNIECSDWYFCKKDLK